MLNINGVDNSNAASVRVEGYVDTEITAIQNTLTGTYDSALITSNRDGNTMQRQEFIIDTLLQTLPVNAVASQSSQVSEGTYGYFYVQLFDIDGNLYPELAIDITSATVLLEKSTLGGEFSVAGITQPTVNKGLGHVDLSILFKADEWAPNDLYRVTLSGIKVTNGVEHSIQQFVWNNVISIVQDIDDEVDTILQYLTVPAVDNTDDLTIADVIGMKNDTPKAAATATIMNNLKALFASSMSKRLNISNVISTTQFATLDLPALGTGGLIGWYVNCSLDAGGLGGAPQGEYRLISGWDKDTGVFTHAAFSETLTTSDKVMIIHPSIYQTLLTKIDTTAIKTETDKIPAEIVKTAAIKTETDKIPAEIVKTSKILSDLEYRQRVYPTLAAGITIDGAAGAWTLGTKTTIVPANTITSGFIILGINIGALSANDTYELVLYSGSVGNEVEIGRIRFVKTTTETVGYIPLQTERIAANTRISAALASSSGNDDVVVSLVYKI